MADEKIFPKDKLTGMEPALSTGVNGREPVLGGSLREWPSIVAHLYSDQLDAQRARDKVRLWAIRQMRARIWQEADEENWLRHMRDVDMLVEGENLSLWQSARYSNELENYERPVYDKISDEVALRAMQHELEALHEGLVDVDAETYPAWIQQQEATIAIVEEYIDRWKEILDKG